MRFTSLFGRAMAEGARWGSPGWVSVFVQVARRSGSEAGGQSMRTGLGEP